MTATTDKPEDPKPQAWALAGEIVRTPRHAMRILVRAQAQDLTHLVPQARNVHAKLKRAAGAKPARGAL